jgi:hypothetical protein
MSGIHLAFLGAAELLQPLRDSAIGGAFDGGFLRLGSGN